MEDGDDGLFADPRPRAEDSGAEESPPALGPGPRFASAGVSAAVVGLAALTLAFWMGKLSARRRIEPAGESPAVLAAIQNEREAAKARIASVASILRDLGRPCPPYGDFLADLSRAVPAGIGLDEVAIRSGNFVVRGHSLESSPDGKGSPPPELLRGLGPPGARWRVVDPRPGEMNPGGGVFAIRGDFLADAFATGAALSPTGETTGQSEATPDAVAQADERLAAALVRLPSTASFEERLRKWGANWNVQAVSAERTPELEVRRYALRSRDLALNSWPALVQRIRTLGGEPAAVLDSLEISAAPDGPEVFSQAEIGIIVRLRP